MCKVCSSAEDVLNDLLGRPLTLSDIEPEPTVHEHDLRHLKGREFSAPTLSEALEEAAYFIGELEEHGRTILSVSHYRIDEGVDSHVNVDVVYE